MRPRFLDSGTKVAFTKSSEEPVLGEQTIFMTAIDLQGGISPTYLSGAPLFVERLIQRL
jgi:hypothetical protein